MTMKTEKINYGTIVDPEKMYPVTYTIKQDGTKVYENTFLKGSDLTEPQIKELTSTRVHSFISDKEKLVLLAKWFDLEDKRKGLDSDINNKEVQQDLLRIAEQLAEKDKEIDQLSTALVTRDGNMTSKLMVSKIASLKTALRKLHNQTRYRLSPDDYRDQLAPYELFDEIENLLK